MRFGRDKTSITARPSLVAIGLVALLATAPARAEGDPNGIVVVTGRATARERAVIQTSIIVALRTANWSMVGQTFAPKEIEAIGKCLRDDKPWRCLSPLMEPKGVDHLVVADANPQAEAGKLVITGELVAAGDGAASVIQRRCDACDEPLLTSAAQHLTEELLKDFASRRETILEVVTVPADATVLLDGRAMGVTTTPGKFSEIALPGPHKVTAQRPGFLPAEQAIDLPTAQTTSIAITLTQTPADLGRSYWAPKALVGGGVAALGLAGYLVYLGQQDGPDDRKRYTRATAIGVATGLAGIAAIGYGVYLWRRGPSTNGFTMTPTPGGLFAGWAGAF
jgi:hypothetical protein